MPKASIDHNEEGMVVWNFPMQGQASGGNMEMTPAQAVVMAHALLLQAAYAMGLHPSVETIRKMKQWVVR